MTDINTPYVKVRIKHLKLSPGMYRDSKAVKSGKFTFEELLDEENKRCMERRSNATKRHQEKYNGNTMKSLKTFHRKNGKGAPFRQWLRAMQFLDEKLTPKMERILAA